MKRKIAISLILGIVLLSCFKQLRTTKLDDTETLQKINTLMSNTLLWADTCNSLDIFPVIENDKDSIYSGIDLEKHKQNLLLFKNTKLFSKGFIANYDQLILTLNKKMAQKEIVWNVGEIPDFFPDGNIWCNCQDVPYDNPNPWKNIEIKLINKKKKAFCWTWGKVNDKEINQVFSYNFSVIKEDNIWKIAYLEGFDLPLNE